MSILDKGMDILSKERQRREEADRQNREAYENRDKAAAKCILELKNKLSDALLHIEHDEKNHLLEIRRIIDGEPLCLVRSRFEFPFNHDGDGGGDYGEPYQKTEMKYLKEYQSSSNITYCRADGCNSGWVHYDENELARFLVMNI
jgi:DNA-binding GntR family transcriptional regulator